MEVHRLVRLGFLFTPVAQLVEHRIPNPRVGGSSPSGRDCFSVSDPDRLVTHCTEDIGSRSQDFSPEGTGKRFLE